MFKRIFALAALAALALLVSSCVTWRYNGPTDHVDYRIPEKLKSSTQSSAVKEGNDFTLSTYDEEFTYDEKGNILKVKQTEYIDRISTEKKFIVWETESKVIGGNLVPYRVTANGVPFLEVTYDILTVAGNGAVVEDIAERSFTRVQSSFFTKPIYENWGIALSNYSVGFRADDRFVKEVRRFDPDRGSYLENALTLGFDNIVLKSFHFSREKLAEGIAKSYTGFNLASAMFTKMSVGINVDYSYEWQVIADRICQTKLTYLSLTLKLEVTEEYNTAGKRIKETWVASNPGTPDQPPVKLFEQILTY
jgi:hypothetical protein